MSTSVSETASVRILIVDDDPAVTEFLRDLLTTIGYQASVACNGSTARASLQELRPDLAILDLMLPDVDGLMLCSEVARAAVPVIVCSGTSRQRDRVLARRLGADDFVTKPVDAEEFEARVAAVLRGSGARIPAKVLSLPERRPGPDGVPKEWRVGEMVISRSQACVMLGGREVKLTTVEYRLVCALARRPNESLSRPELADSIWGYQTAAKGRALDVHVARVRKKLRQFPRAPRLLPVRGYGYKMVSDVYGRTSAA